MSSDVSFPKDMPIYLPARFTAGREDAFELIRDFPLATVLTVSGGIFASHLPLVFDGEDTLVGHLARANPQSSRLEAELVALFHGPHAYVSPRWYRSGRNVPTWNYAAVHVTGRGRVVEDPEDLLKILRLQAAVFDPEWDFSLSEDRIGPTALNRSIVGFRLRIERIEAKFKLSQNRTAVDRQGVAEGLLAVGGENERWIAKRMSSTTQGRNPDGDDQV